MTELFDTVPGVDLFVKQIGVDKETLNEMLDDEFYGDSYLLDIPTIRQLTKKRLNFSSRVTFLVGENGSGKSTLIEGIATALFKHLFGDNC